MAENQKEEATASRSPVGAVASLRAMLARPNPAGATSHAVADSELALLLDVAEAAQEYREAQHARRNPDGSINADFTLQIEPRERLDAALARLRGEKL